MKREVKIGIFAVAMLALAWAGIRFLSGLDVLSRNVEYVAVYDQVNGVREASAVMLKGVKVGSVSRIALDPSNHNKVLLYLTVRRTYQIPEDFRQSILMDVMRGGRKLMLYGDLGDLDESDHAYLSFVNTLFTRATEADYTPRLFGDPARGGVYGYDTGCATEGLGVVVNPTAHDVIHYVASPRFGGGVTATPVIVNGEIVEPAWQDVGNAIPVRVSSHGYTLVAWRLTPMERGLDKVVMLPGDSITLRTEGMTAMELSFTKDGAPLKTVTGFPPQFSVTGGGTALTPSLQNPVWAGISWAHYRLNGVDRVTLTNESDLSFTLKYQFK